MAQGDAETFLPRFPELGNSARISQSTNLTKAAILRLRVEWGIE